MIYACLYIIILNIYFYIYLNIYFNSWENIISESGNFPDSHHDLV